MTDNGVRCASIAGAIASLPAAGHQIPAAVFFSTLAVLSLIDWRTRYLPDRLQLIAFGATVAEAVHTAIQVGQWRGPTLAWSAGVLGGIALFALARRLSGDQLGLGDVKLAGGCGAWLALVAPTAIFTALAVMAGTGLILARWARGRAFAYGPAICAGTYAACLGHLAQ